MNLIIQAPLSEPPSEISCFRDLTLYGKMFIFDDILIECKSGTRSLYWKWLKRHGAHDFVSQLVNEEEKVVGFKIATMQGNYIIDRICCENLPTIIATLNKFKKYL